MPNICSDVTNKTSQSQAGGITCCSAIVVVHLDTGVPVSVYGGQVLSGNLQGVQGVGALAPPTERASAYLDIVVAMGNWSTKFVDVNTTMGSGEMSCNCASSA